MTAPLVAADVDLRDFAYMPLDVLRLRDSDLAAEATDAEFRAAVMLWCAAWHQIPAASLPDSDAVLAKLCGLGRDIDGWRAIRGGAMRGWVKCDDGRLYHPVVAEKANEAWAQKKRQRERTAAARAARHPRREDGCYRNPDETTTVSVTETVTDDVTCSKGTERNGTDSVAIATCPPAEPADAPQSKKAEKSESDIALLDRITDRWNAWARLHGSPAVIRLTAKRGAHCRRRITDLMQFGHETPEAAFDWLLAKVDQSFFARGSPRKPLEFDQLLSDNFVTRMVEGSFEFRQPARGQRPWVS